MSVGVHHVSVFIVDVNRSLHLFRDILGLKLLWQAPVGGRMMAALMGLPEVEAELYYLQSENGGPALELIRLIRPDRSEIPPLLGSRGSVILSLQVKEIESLHQRSDGRRLESEHPVFSSFLHPRGRRLNSSPSAPKKGWPWNSSRKWNRPIPPTRDLNRPGPPSPPNQFTST